jgi:hypothetical protein
MTISPIAIQYEWQHKLLDTGFPYVTIPLLKNSTLSAASGTLADAFTGGLAEVYLHIWASGFTGGSSPTITFSIQDLNQATYSAQLAGQSTTAGQETGGAPTADSSSALTLTPTTNTAIIKHTVNIVSDLTRVSYTTTGTPTSANNVFVYLVGKPFQRGA